MRRVVELFLAVSSAFLLVPALAGAAARMPVGFHDDPTFRWSADTAGALDDAQAAHASIIRTVADWRAIAPSRPARATNPFDRAYRLADLDQLVRNAQERGIEVMITIWGTPRWANGGKSPNVPPRRPADLTNFARAIADRYSGRHAGYPYVGRYSIWNEPNLEIFLKPQFSRTGKIVSPHTYANLYKAGYKGIKAANRSALVAIGETSNQGRDHPAWGNANESVAPGTFARLLALEKGLRFDAYATHPYPTLPHLPPTQKVRWPNVTLTQLKRFETSIDQWFHRSGIPVWITEYGYQTRPGEPMGVTNAQQASYLSKVMRQLKADPRVQMFIWFIFRDAESSLWQSGLFNLSGSMKPSYKTFKALAGTIAGQTLTIKPGIKPTVKLTVPRLAFPASTGTTIDVRYRVYRGGKLVVSGQRSTKLLVNQSVSFVANFKPASRSTYTINVTASDPDGSQVKATYGLVTTDKKAADKSA